MDREGGGLEGGPVKVTVLVRCDGCAKEFRTRVGWVAYDERVWLRMISPERREGATMRQRRAGGPKLGRPTRWQMRIPLRARWCGDHDEGTRDCRGQLRRIK